MEMPLIAATIDGHYNGPRCLNVRHWVCILCGRLKPRDSTDELMLVPFKRRKERREKKALTIGDVKSRRRIRPNS